MIKIKANDKNDKVKTNGKPTSSKITSSKITSSLSKQEDEIFDNAFKRKKLQEFNARKANRSLHKVELYNMPHPLR